MQASMFVLGVFRRADRYLVIEERDGSWYLPAGRVEEAESLLDALARETTEEAGQNVHVEGLLALDHEWWPSPPRTRLRFVFVGLGADDRPPKSVADHHSRGAAWLTVEEIRRLPLRHIEVLDWIERSHAQPTLLPVPSDGWMAPPTRR